MHSYLILCSLIDSCSRNLSSTPMQAHQLSYKAFELPLSSRSRFVYVFGLQTRVNKHDQNEFKQPDSTVSELYENKVVFRTQCTKS